MISCVIQSGGRSSRMGKDKGLISLGGIPLIEHVISKIESISSEILITTNFPEKYRYLGCNLLQDQIPGAGALPGLKTALEGAINKTVLVLACDLPFVNTALLSHQITFSHNWDAVVPIWKDRYQPFHAVYNKDACLPALEAALHDGKNRMISFYPDIEVKTINDRDIMRFSPWGLSFFNINSPNDLIIAEEIFYSLRNENGKN